MMKRLTHTIALLFLALSLSAQAGLWLQRSQAGPVGNTGILDSYAGAAFAAAPDVLIYGGYADTMANDNIVGSQTNGTQGAWTVTLYRDSDGAYSSFEWDEIAALDDPGGWCAGVNCLVRRLWDQSGNGNHADQATVGDMPKLVDSVTGLVVENGKAALDFDADFFTISGSASTFKFMHDGTTNTSFLVLKAGNTLDPNAVYSVMGNNGGTVNKTGFCFIYDDRASLSRNNSILYFAGNDNRQYVIRIEDLNNTFPPNIQQLIYINSDADNAVLSDRINIAFDGGAAVTTNASSATPSLSNSDFDLHIGTSGGNVAPFKGSVQVWVIYPTDQSANRAAIETAINNEYTIY